ncbi:MAG: phospho-N-acetylmuramoyl-pentapeptide-transferase [Candidatus Latescibacteria bacterium]|nr:phospho-N-acetylmuramoyl-pentapeptide-transferase [Candidatus Latescibacterota bacterium]
MLFLLGEFVHDLYVDLAGTHTEWWMTALGASRLLTYITSRAILAALTSFLVTIVAGHRIIRYLHRHGIRDVAKDFGAISVTDKRGTPSMGGLLILLALVVPALLWCDLTNRFVQLSLAATVWFGGLGALDDLLKIKGRSGRDGLAPWQKLLAQGGFGCALGLIYLDSSFSPAPSSVASNLYVPFSKAALVGDVGWWYLAVIVFVVLLISNSVNLTDGMDGLAVVPASFVSGVFGVIAYIMGNVVWSEYLQYPHMTGAGEVLIFSSAVFSACIGFLWYNAYPAQIIMGDTGSIALGGILATLAVLLKLEVLFVIVGGVFIAETASSFIQEKIGVGLIGRRIFYRAPLHHNYEHGGLAETKVVIRFWIVSGILALLALASIKLR